MIYNYYRILERRQHILVTFLPIGSHERCSEQMRLRILKKKKKVKIFQNEICQIYVYLVVKREWILDGLSAIEQSNKLQFVIPLFTFSYNLFSFLECCSTSVECGQKRIRLKNVFCGKCCTSERYQKKLQKAMELDQGRGTYDAIWAQF